MRRASYPERSIDDGQLSAAQLLAHAHEDSTEHVLARPVAAVAPVVVVVGETSE
jgi:hypothetical protein